MPSTVLLDANLLRHAEPWRFPDSDAHPAQRSTITMPPYGAVAAEPRGALGSSHAWLTSQLDAIPRIGEFARKGHIKCFVSELVMLELTDQPRGRHATGMLGDFRDVRFEEVPPPLPLPAEITDSQIPWTTRRDRITRWFDEPPVHYVKGFSGMTLAIPADAITELLEMPKLKEPRERALAEVRHAHRNDPVAEAAEPEALDGNPRH